MESKELAGRPVKVFDRAIDTEMRQSYLDYAMSVIVGRALPDVRDGLKPVHRRILYAMKDLGLTHDKPFKKSARIVGEVLGKYHPHGDTAVYDSMVRMVQDFSLRYPLVQGQGNFGSVDGDRAAAMRYTEARLRKQAEEMLQDIDKKTVKFVPNFDESLKEPTVLPCKFPNLLANGSSGIAVGMATNIPPHNLPEICDGVKALIENPEIELNEIMTHIRGPDFPTAGTVCGTAGIKQAYHHGTGRIKVRAKTHPESKGNKQRIIVTELPYQVNKAMLVEHIAYLVRQKRIIGISDLRDESDQKGMRVVIELKQGANYDVVLNQLYKFTKLQNTFGIIMLALVDNEPKIMGIKPMMQHFVSHRQEVVRKRTEFDLAKAKARHHILQGLLVALRQIDKIIAEIKASKDVPAAMYTLMERHELSELQAKAILDMRLQKLASLEQQKIKDEHDELIKAIKELQVILADERRILTIIKDELDEMKERYGDERRTEIQEVEGEEIEIEDLIKKETMILTITHRGYIKRLSPDKYKQQRRGGKGVIAAGKRDGDFIEDMFMANTHSYLLVFTNRGKVHWVKVYKVPEASRHAKGIPIVNLLDLEKDEKVAAFVPVSDFSKGYLVMATKNGTVKKTSLAKFARPRRGGIIALTISPADELITVRKTDGDKRILLATKRGLAVKFHEKGLRPIGRTAAGVRGIRLRAGDELVGMVIADESEDLLTITEKGYGKRTPIKEYRLINRGGSGVININCSSRNGQVVEVRAVDAASETIIISREGIAIRIPVSSISRIGRNTQGVRVMKLREGDSVVAAAKLVKEEPIPEPAQDKVEHVPQDL